MQAVKKISLFPVSYPQENVNRIFDSLDVSDTTRLDYKYRIGAFLDYTRKHGININSFLDYKRCLSSRTDYSVSTKNKYLAAAKIFLKELNRKGILPNDITQNVKSFSQDKKHKKDGLNTEEINSLCSFIGQLPITQEKYTPESHCSSSNTARITTSRNSKT